MRKPNWFIGYPIEKAAPILRVLLNPPPGYRLFHSLDLHLTFAFLGQVKENEAYAAWRVAETCNCKPSKVMLGPLKPFGSVDRPSALSFTIQEGDAQLKTCKDNWQLKMLQAAGQPPDPWGDNWRPHITVSRPPRGANDTLRAVGSLWAQGIIPPAGWISLDHLALYTWHDDRKVRQFKIVASRRLG